VLEEAGELIRQGWKPYVKTISGKRYIVLQKGGRSRSLGPYTEEKWARVLELAGGHSEKGVGRGVEESSPFTRMVPRWKGDLEEAGAGPSLIAEEVPPEVPELGADLLAVRSHPLEAELAERRRRMLEEARLELELLHLERLRRLEGGERGEEPQQLDLQLLTLCALAAGNPWEALALYYACLALRQLLPA
jgi:hypothetical protein